MDLTPLRPPRIHPLAMDERGPTVHMYGIVLLHDLVQWNINENPEVRKGVHGLKRRMGIGYDRQVEFLPYWTHQDKCQLDSGDVVVSFYRRGERLMAVLVNTRMEETCRGGVVLDLEKLGIGNVQRVELYDPMRNIYTRLGNTGAAGTVTFHAEIPPTLFKAALLNWEH